VIRSLQVATLVVTGLAIVACGTSQPSPSPRASVPPSAVPSAPPTATPTASPTIVPATQPPSIAPSPSPTETTAAAALLIEVTSEGGFIAPQAHLGQLPTVVVDTAGNIYTPDPNFSGAQLIPQAVVRNVGTAGASAILDAMRAAGLDKVTDNGGPGNPDAGVTVFTAEIDGQEVVNRIAGGQPGPGGPGASPNPAIDLLNRLLDPTDTWGAADVTSTAFTPTAYKIYAAPAASGSGSAVAWPLAGSLDAFGTPATPDFGITGLRTGVAFGDDAPKIAAAFATAAADTLVTSGGTLFQVWIRPLLPPELS
jgi:hypothetical protein